MMMAPIAVMYTVRATCPDEATRARYIDWLANGHAQAVKDGGATAAVIVQLDSEPPAAGARAAFKVEVRYAFQDRPALERYFQEFAPGLRADGLRLFGPDSGVTLERTIGDAVWAG